MLKYSPRLLTAVELKVLGGSTLFILAKPPVPAKEPVAIRGKDKFPVLGAWFIVRLVRCGLWEPCAAMPLGVLVLEFAKLVDEVEIANLDFFDEAIGDADIIGENDVCDARRDVAGVKVKFPDCLNGDIIKLLLVTFMESS